MRHQKPATSGKFDPTQPFVVAHEFDDVDELVEVTKAWDLDFRQLNRGGFRGCVRQAMIGPLHLADTKLDGTLHQRGTTPADMWTFCFPGHSDMEFRWRDHPVGANDLLIHPPGGEFESISNHGFELLLLSVSGEDLEAAGRRLGVKISERSLKCLEITTCEPKIVSDLRHLVTTSLALLVEGQHLTETIEHHACDLVIRGLARGNRTESRARRSRRQRLGELAIRLARDRAHEIHSVRDLCRESGAAERTLRRVFNERFGISPKSYLQAQRLIGVHRTLRFSDRSERISDIANRWGFWHMGQFAADYKRQFGELPSETVRRARRTGLEA